MRQDGTTFSKCIIFLLKCCVHSSDSVGDENVLKGNGQTSHQGSSLCETRGGRGISANPSAVTIWSQHLAPVSKCAPHIVTGGVSHWVTSYMECRVVVPPSLRSAAAEVGSPAHGHTEHTGSSTPFSVPHFLGSFTFSVSQSHLLLFWHMLV